MKKAQIYRARYLIPIAAEPIEDGALLVVDGRIAAVGRRSEVVASTAGVSIVDFGDAILLPPLVNAHTHLELTHFPLWARSSGATPCIDTFVDWIKHVIRIKRQLSADRFNLSLAAGIKESLAAGTGAVGDILSFFPARTAYAGSPLRGRIFLESLGQDSDTNRQLLNTIEEIIGRGRVGETAFGVAPHSLYTLSIEYQEEIFATARRLGKQLTIHLAESAAEVEFLGHAGGPIADKLYPFVGWSDKVPPATGRRPLEILAGRGGLQTGTLLAHGVHVTEEDVARIAAAGAAVALCSRSNARLGAGRAPVELYRRAGVLLSLGTDSRASCDSLSIWDELAFARTWFAGACSPAEWLAIATHGGAQALGLGVEMGRVAAGYGVHFQVLAPPALPSRGELEEFLCSPGRTDDVKALYLAGADVLS
jgi:cytosine/adenosine deaminase-related metal-dependent hydrolase